MKARYVYLPVIGQTVCPASMCPLFAKDGSPWTSEKNARCPKHAHDPDRPGSEGCGFWDNGCDGAGGAMNQVEEAREYGGTLQIGPVHQKRHELARPTPSTVRAPSSANGSSRFPPSSARRGLRSRWG